MALWLFFAPMTLFVVSAVKNRDLKWSMGYWRYVDDRVPSKPDLAHAISTKKKNSFTFPLTGWAMTNSVLGELLPSKTFSSVQVLFIFIIGGAWLVNTPFMVYSIFISRDLLVPKAPKEVLKTVVAGDEEASVAIEPEPAGLRPRRGRVTSDRRQGEDAPSVEA
jgi:hypothetical protein